jgi:hypothetical protein
VTPAPVKAREEDDVVKHWTTNNLANVHVDLWTGQEGAGTYTLDLQFVDSE